MINNFWHYNFFNFLNKSKIIKKFCVNNIVIAKVLQIKKKFVILDGNLKFEFFIKKNEFFKNKNFIEIKENDYIEIFLINIENSYNKIISSRIKLRSYVFWKNILKIFKKKIFIKGEIFNKIKGGYSVHFDDFRCFLPHSCTDKKSSNFFYYFQKKIYFLILNFDYLKKNIVLSRKLLIFKIFNVKKKIFFKNIKPGNILKGIVKRLTSYCAFIDLGYLDAVIFFKNLTWGNHIYLNEFLCIGKSIIAIVLKVDKKKYRVFLGIKQLFNFWKKIFFLKKFSKYIRIFRVNSNHIYAIFSKNIISYINNNLGFGIFNFLNINDYKIININYINFKRRRINIKFKYYPCLA